MYRHMVVHASLYRGIVMACLVALGLLVCMTDTQAVGWESAVRISDGTGGWYYPQVAVDGQYVHVVWRDDAVSVLKYRRSTDGGSTWQPIQTLASVGGIHAPCVAASGGYVHVAWRGGLRIRYRRSTNYGATFQSEMILDTEADSGFDPSVAAFGRRVCVTWIRHGPNYDVIARRSYDRGITWNAIEYLTFDNGLVNESCPRTAVWNAYFYIVYFAEDPAGNDRVLFTRSTTFTWTFPVSVFSEPHGILEGYIAVAAEIGNVYVDRYDDTNGPVQRISYDNGTSFGSAVSLGNGIDLGQGPEADARLCYLANGCHTYIRGTGLYVSTGPGSETMIGTAGGNSGAADIATDGNANIHVVCASQDTGHEVYYYRNVGPEDFIDGGASGSGTGVSRSDAAWGDFDGDGDEDVAICGEDSYSTIITKTYENENGTLSFRQNLTGVNNQSGGGLAWGDYNGDGDLDLAIAGLGASGRVAEVYENDGDGNLTLDTGQVLTPVSFAALAWADYDLDGDLDLVVCGHDGAGASTILYRNEPHGQLSADTTSLTGVYAGSADWFDYDGDNDQDLVVTGNDGTQLRTIFYLNDPPGSLVDDGDHGLPGFGLSDIACGDYDSDGDVDLAVTGNPSAGPAHITSVYRNDGSGVFAGFADLDQVYRSSCAWGDYDNDGYLDLAVCGYTGSGFLSKIYRNAGTGFSKAFDLPSAHDGSLTWVDADQDGDLDLFVTGSSSSTRYACLYFRVGGLLNTSPTAPTGLTCGIAYGGRLQLTWIASTDVQTPQSGLCYCLRVGTSSGADDILSGTFGSPMMGNIGQATVVALDVPDDTYYWSVKAVDSGLAPSEWSTETSCDYSGVTSWEAHGTPEDVDLDLHCRNPFRPGCRLEYSIARPGAVRITLYDLRGRRVRTLAESAHGAGAHSIEWNGCDSSGNEVASGLYFCRFEALGNTLVAKLVLTR